MLTNVEQVPRAVVVAPPGAGKSTYVPLHLLRSAWAEGKKVILLEPRRVAARAVAQRMAELLGEKIGETVGYIMRMDNKYSAKTRLYVMTEGSFTRFILDKPELTDIAAIIFDEFHERSLEADFGLALTLDVANSLRPDLRVVIMSATLDGARVADLLTYEGHKAPVIEAQGRTHPIEILYRPNEIKRRKKALTSKDVLAEHMAKVCADMLEYGGSILAFLPGQGEIKRTQKKLEEELLARQYSNAFIAPLFGSLTRAEQEYALKPAKKGLQKIVLATSIAESALTIEDIHIVVDSGFARVPVYEPVTGITHLKTVRASQASIEQRAGRAGRLQAGIAVRLWYEEQSKALPLFTPAEILSADMTNIILDCADFGVSTIDQLRFLDTPPKAAIIQAYNSLQSINVLDDTHRITPLGRALRRLPLPVLLAHMLFSTASKTPDSTVKAARLAIMLTEKGLGGANEDLDIRLANFTADRSLRAQKAHKLADNLAEKATELARDTIIGQNKESSSQPEIETASSEASVGQLLAKTWWQYIAQLRENSDSKKTEAAQYLLANGRGASISKTSPLYQKKWLVCAETTGQAANTHIRAAAEIEKTWFKQHLQDKITQETEVYYDSESHSLRALNKQKLGAILLHSEAISPPEGEEANLGWLRAIREHGLSILPWNKETENLRKRLAFLHQRLRGAWPTVDDTALLKTIEDWLLPFLPGKAQFDDNAQFLQKALAFLPGYELERQIDVYAPSCYQVPSGSKLPIDYRQDKAILPVRVQELFGLNTQPKIAEGKIPLLLELLSPAGRVIQITADIAGFWQGSWHDVAAEMRGRYPKHSWPQNPEEAEATNKTKSSKK